MSASAICRASLGVGLFVLAAAIVAAKSAALLSGYGAAYASSALREAMVAEKGAVREQAFAKALNYANDGLNLSGNDPRLLGLRAETLLGQALDHGVATATKELTAATTAAHRTIVAAPNDSAAHARLALIEALQGRNAEASAALKRSYELDITSATIGHRRLEAAGRIWNKIGAEGQRNVVNEACMLASRGEDDRGRLQRLRLGAAEPGMALRLDEILADGACRASAG